MPHIAKLFFDPVNNFQAKNRPVFTGGMIQKKEHKNLINNFL